MRMLRLLSVLSVLSLPAFADEDRSSSLDPSFRGQGAINDASAQRRAQMISGFIGIPAWYWGYGGFPFSVGGRFYQPILHDGFIPPVNDSFGLEFGADFVGIGARSFGGIVGLPIEGLWAFHFTPKFAAYMKLGLALELYFGTLYWPYGGYTSTVAVGLQPIAGVGGWYKFSDKVSLRFELGYPGLKVGLGFDL